MRRAAHRSAVLTLVTLLTIVLIACGGDGTRTPTHTATATDRPETSSVAATPTAPPVPAASATSTAPGGSSVTISAVGDVSLARELVSRMEANGGDYPYALITQFITGDIGLANLEGAMTDRGEPWRKGYTFRTPPRFTPGLANAGFDVVSLANNHSMDYGQVGLLDTISALDAAGVEYIGAGADDTRAHAPVVVEANGLRVAFLGYVATPDEGARFSISEWAAGPDAPGVAYASNAAIAAGVAAAREMADFVIVVVHAGTEYQNAPDAEQQRIAAAAMAAGADAYIGAHAHVVQPVEHRDGQLIAWGLGNFIFDLDDVDLANIPVPRVSLVLNITLTKDAGVTSWEAVPVTLDADQDRPRPATESEAAVLRALLQP